MYLYILSKLSDLYLFEYFPIIIHVILPPNTIYLYSFECFPFLMPFAHTALLVLLVLVQVSSAVTQVRKVMDSVQHQLMAAIINIEMTA